MSRPSLEISRERLSDSEVDAGAGAVVGGDADIDVATVFGAAEATDGFCRSVLIGTNVVVF
jgi:hypothetical protein